MRYDSIEEQLDITRQALLSAIPPELWETVQEMYRVPFDDAYRWQWSIVQKVIELAEAQLSELAPDPLVFDNPYRVPCPLCHGIPNGPYYSPGFTVPEGMKRHLMGQGRAVKCDVLEALWVWGRSYLQKAQEIKQRNAAAVSAPAGSEP